MIRRVRHVILYNPYNPPEPRTIALESGKLVAHTDSMEEAYHDVKRGRVSYTYGSLRVMRIPDEPHKYQLMDGYHRLIEHMLLGHRRVPVSIHSYNINYGVETPRQRFEFLSGKYSGLERMGSPDELKEAARRIR